MLKTNRITLFNSGKETIKMCLCLCCEHKGKLLHYSFTSGCGQIEKTGPGAK